MMEVKLKKVLNRELKSRTMTVTSLSRETGIPRTTLHDWYTGRLPSSKNIHYLYKLSAYFKISLSLLLFDTQDTDMPSNIVHTSFYIDGGDRFKLTIEKMMSQHERNRSKE